MSKRLKYAQANPAPELGKRAKKNFGTVKQVEGYDEIGRKTLYASRSTGFMNYLFGEPEITALSWPGWEGDWTGENSPDSAMGRHLTDEEFELRFPLELRRDWMSALALPLPKNKRIILSKKPLDAIPVFEQVQLRTISDWTRRPKGIAYSCSGEQWRLLRDELARAFGPDSQNARRSIDPARGLMWDDRIDDRTKAKLKKRLQEELYVYSVDVNLQKVLALRSVDDLLRFTQRYFDMHRFHGPVVYGINWAEVAQKYSAIEICPNLRYAILEEAGGRIAFGDNYVEAMRDIYNLPARNDRKGWAGCTALWYDWPDAGGIIWNPDAVKNLQLHYVLRDGQIHFG